MGYTIIIFGKLHKYSGPTRVSRGLAGLADRGESRWCRSVERAEVRSDSERVAGSYRRFGCGAGADGTGRRGPCDGTPGRAVRYFIADRGGLLHGSAREDGGSAKD